MCAESLTRPKLRWPLETEQVEHDGQKFLVLRDRAGVAPEPAVVPAPLVPVLARFDGETELAQIAAEGAAWGITLRVVGEMAESLRAMGFLDTPDTNLRFEQLRAEFIESSVRKAILADIIYPAEPEKLRAEIENYLTRTENSYRPRREGEKVVGLVCPHIDYRRGWQGYAASYSVLQRTAYPEVIFLLGTSHQGGKSCFQLTRKTFSTPLGTFAAATEVIDDIVAVYGEKRSFQDEYLHKHEHSLELQLPFLAHAFERQGNLPQIVPILVGSFHEFLNGSASPMENQEVSDFVGILSESIKRLRLSGKSLLVYGGIDLSHVGLHFGDSTRMSSDESLRHIASRDRELLDTVLQAEEEALFQHIAEDSDRRRVCGFPSTYTMLAAFRQAGIATNGHLVEYRQAVNPANDCIVTFASACWTERE